MKFVAITMLASPQKEIAASRNVARCNAIGKSAGGMLANTTRARRASVVAWEPDSMGAGMFWTFVEASQISDGAIRIEGKKGHHLARVLRVRPGEHGVAVCGGREYELEVSDVQGERVIGRVLDERPARGEARTGVTLLQAVPPNPDFDAVIEAGTAA